MIWNGKELRTIGELGDAVSTLSSQAEADEFMDAYRAETEHADVNIGYLSGYYDQETMRRIQELCGVEHPIFGKAEPTPDQAFAAGQLMGMTGFSPESMAAVRSMLVDPLKEEAAK